MGLEPSGAVIKYLYENHPPFHPKPFLAYPSPMPTSRSASLMAVLAFLLPCGGCFAPPQDFPIGSAFWKAANPELEGSVAPNPGAHRVLVGVLDAGLDYNDPLLRKHIHVFRAPEASGRAYGVGFDTLGHDFFPSFRILNTSNGQDMSGDLLFREHGTHVAQLVALNDPAIGLIPVRVLPLAIAPEDSEIPADPLARMLAVRDPAFLARVARGSVDSIAAGLEFAIAHGASIVNMSFGISLDELLPSDRDEVMARVEKTISARIASDWKHCLMVVAAGNDHELLDRPSQTIPATLQSPDILSVGALKDRRLVAGYSNRGRYVDVWVRGTGITSSVPGGRARKSGTSMASPIVAHAAAQLKSIDPTLTPSQLRALILNTADSSLLPFDSAGAGGASLPAPQTVRVLNMRAARAAARRLLSHPEERPRWLTPPFAHGNAPH